MSYLCLDSSKVFIPRSTTCYWPYTSAFIGERFLRFIHQLYDVEFLLDKPGGKTYVLENYGYDDSESFRRGFLIKESAEKITEYRPQKPKEKSGSVETLDKIKKENGMEKIPDGGDLEWMYERFPNADKYVRELTDGLLENWGSEKSYYSKKQINDLVKEYCLSSWC